MMSVTTAKDGPVWLLDGDEPLVATTSVRLERAETRAGLARMQVAERRWSAVAMYAHAALEELSAVQLVAAAQMLADGVDPGNVAALLDCSVRELRFRLEAAQR